MPPGHAGSGWLVPGVEGGAESRLRLPKLRSQQGQVAQQSQEGDALLGVRHVEQKCRHRAFSEVNWSWVVRQRVEINWRARGP